MTVKRALVGGCVAFTLGWCAGLTGIAWLIREFAAGRRDPHPF